MGGIAGPFSEGLALGREAIEQRRARKQQLSDEEFQAKAGLYAEELQGNRAKLANIDRAKNPKEYEATIAAMQQNLHDIGELYHPDRNPGAIEKFGHLLTDKLGITNPQQRLRAEVAKRTAKTAEESRMAQGLAEAAPPTAEQMGVQAAQAGVEAKIASVQAALKAFDTLMPDASPEERQTFRDEITRGTFGIKEPKEAAEKYYKELVTTTDAEGKPHYWRVPMEAGDQPEEVDFQGQKISGKPTKSVRAWTKAANGRPVSVLLDPQTNQIIPGSEDPSILPPPYLTPRISTGVYHWTDEQNQIHETPESRTSRPVMFGGAGAAPPAPAEAPRPSAAGARPAAAPTPAVAGARPAAKPTAATAGALKRAAQARDKAINATAGPKGDRILGLKASGPLNKARTEYAEAVKLASLADDTVANPNNAEMQFLLVDNILHGALGRVNEVEINKIQSRGGWTMAPQRWEQEARAGTMPPALIRQLQDFTRSQVKANKAAVDALGGATAAPAGGPAAPARKGVTNFQYDPSTGGVK